MQSEEMEKTEKERTRAFLETFVGLVVRHPEKVKVEVREGWHQSIPEKIVTTFLITVEDPRDAAILIGVGGKNVQTLREIVHVIACQNKFTPARIEILDPLRAAKVGGGKE